MECNGTKKKSDRLYPLSDSMMIKRKFLKKNDDDDDYVEFSRERKKMKTK